MAACAERSGCDEPFHAGWRTCPERGERGFRRASPSIPGRRRNGAIRKNLAGGGRQSELVGSLPNLDCQACRRGSADASPQQSKNERQSFPCRNSAQERKSTRLNSSNICPYIIP